MRLLRIFIVVLASGQWLGTGRERPSDPPLPPRGRSSQGSELASEGVRAYRAQIRARIASSGTFMVHMLRESDSLLVRWPSTGDTPVTVHIGWPDRAPGRRREIVAALHRWESTSNMPVRFELVADPDQAMIDVRWVQRLPWFRTGQTDVRWGPGGWLERAVVSLSEWDRGGASLTGAALRAVALHEIGHALGLGHSDDERDVMYPVTGIHDLSVRDRTTAELLYALAAGSLREPVHR